METASQFPSETEQRIQTEGDLNLVKRFLLLRIAVQILDHDIGIAGASSMKLPRLYESILRALQDRVLLDQAAAKREMIAGGILIHREQRHAEGLKVQYAIRGYQHEFTMLWPFVRREAEQLLGQYRQPRQAAQRG
ncbi:hypothetical protein [Paenibacillus daejeonensis]|uniref:hypothetical protein n=1 Tax=Paenibacillus daejeonensis TaxID=135193 RepID=UPI00036DC7B6|nr:hypothetical protein [Paenibacillus daejeonensis]